MTQRSRKSSEQASAQEDPRKGGKGQARGSRSLSAGVHRRGDEPQDMGMLVPATPTTYSAPELSTKGGDPTAASLAPAAEPELSHYKGVSLKNVGRDVRGRVIPHKRSEKIAKQIKIWVAGGFNVNDIAIRINVRPGLIKKEYERELAVGETEIHMDVHDHLLKRVKQSDRMAIFYAKARMGYRDGDGKPMETGILSINIHV